MSDHEVKLTCPNCGSDDIWVVIKSLVSYPIKQAIVDEAYNLSIDEVGCGEHIDDNQEGVDFPYDCRHCNKIEMTETDLMYDGKHHPAWVEPTPD